MTTNNTQTTADVKPNFVLIWSSYSSLLPHGWTVCNGQNRTHNLEGKMVVCNGPQIQFGATGSGTHAHAVKEDNIKLAYPNIRNADGKNDITVYNPDSNPRVIIDSNTEVAQNLPPFVALHFITPTA